MWKYLEFISLLFISDSAHTFNHLKHPKLILVAFSSQQEKMHLTCIHSKYLGQFVFVSKEMNVESSRSHLIVSIMVESRNLTNGSVSTGKLSFVDLAGSERAAKTGAKDHQLKVWSFPRLQGWRDRSLIL